MKKFLIMLFLSVFLILAGCSGEKPGPASWSQEDLVAIGTSDQGTVRYGMTRKEIEEIAGEPQGTSEEASTKGNTLYEGGLSVGYRDDVAAELVIEGDGWKTNKDAAIGNTLEQIERLCGTTDFSRGTIIVGSTAHLVQYLFDGEGTLFSQATVPDKITTSDEYYIVSFESEKNRVIRIRICDVRYSYERK